VSGAAALFLFEAARQRRSGEQDGRVADRARRPRSAADRRRGR
jgi:hypothetical protein